MSTQTLHWRGTWARVGPWRGHDDVALITVSTDTPATPDLVGYCLTRLRALGYRAVVTGALSPAGALAFVDAGFTVRERLHLLAHDTGAPLPPPGHPTRRARRSEQPAVLALDALCFEPPWRIDSRALRDTLVATPAVRFRVVDDPDVYLAGYAIAGRAGTHGYLQRLAVHPAVHRRGLGRTLVADALGWMARHGVERTLVNTQLHNDAALRLYEACGFRRLPVGLCVFGRSL
ncbi:MAG: GNAT family N-acetyltransferase [Acidimicrobiia bacterium]|nr:GNAT family N-acetyltransferase [Acidimicrobiia bacterium]